MKRSRIWMLLLALGPVCGPARAQWVVTDPGAIMQGIVNSVNEMVETAATKENVFRNFEQTVKIYNQTKEYYDRLKAVNEMIRGARKVAQCVSMVSAISTQYIDTYKRLSEDRNLSVRELAAIARGYTRLIQESTYVLKELQDIVTPSGLSMTDKERMDIVNQSYAELLRLRNLTDYYSRKNLSVSLSRARREIERERLRALYGTPADQYD